MLTIRKFTSRQYSMFCSGTSQMFNRRQSGPGNGNGRLQLTKFEKPAKLSMLRERKINITGTWLPRHWRADRIYRKKNLQWVSEFLTSLDCEKRGNYRLAQSQTRLGLTVSRLPTQSATWESANDRQLAHSATRAIGNSVQP